MSSDRYPFGEIEAKWQRAWEERKQFRVTEDPNRPKFYCLEMFPYPSGRIHMGHVRNYAIGDLLARYKAMRGFNVLHPMGWDAFGLPAWCDRLPGWPERVLTMQRNWIGRSEGVEFDLPTVGRPGVRVRVFTTRPDTAFGMTYAVLAPEHPVVDHLVTDAGERAAVAQFRAEVAKESEIERLAADRPKRGLRLLARVVNPFNGAVIPLFLGNYVLTGYGTGAIMAVPGEDQRDWDFARQHGLPIIETVRRPPGWTGEAYKGDGIKINSGFLDGLTVAEAKRKATDWLVAQGLGEAKGNYRPRDWGVSRQRYWGAPIPVPYCDTCGMVPEAEENLPVVLPRDVQISGKGGSPLAHVKSFVNAKCPRCRGRARRDTDTMDTFVESSWYFFRYCSPHYEGGMFERGAAEYWMPVDQYIGGIEHAVLHLLYARFYTKVLRDLGLVKVDEPFTALLSQGMVIKDGAKMSKSKGNVVSDDFIREKYGADTGRLFELFAAPPEKDLEWNDHGVEGASRFLNRVWRFVLAHLDEVGGARRPADGPPDRARAATVPTPSTEAGRAFRRQIHETIQRVTEDIEHDFHFNTAISAIMELVNALYAFEAMSPDAVPAAERLVLLSEAVETVILLLGPFCPHITEELWAQLGHRENVFRRRWPVADPAALKKEEVTIVVQVDGKVRGRLVVDVDAAEDRVRQLALGDDRVRPSVP